MKEWQAIDLIKKIKNVETAERYIDRHKAFGMAIKALEEIQQYRAIGTVEECREARERQRAKVPNIWGDGYDDEGNMIYDMYDCPNCGKSYEVDYDNYKFCPNCGQAIERSDLEKLI